MKSTGCGAFLLRSRRVVADIDDLRSGTRGLPLDRDFVFLPINNNQDVEQPSGGSHWSLLVYVRRAPLRRRLWHVDSLAGSGNKAIADEAARVLLSLGVIDADSGVVVEVPCAQQRNGFDCGAFVLEQCERIARFRAADGELGDPVAEGPLRDALLVGVDGDGLRRRILAEVTALQRQSH